MQIPEQVARDVLVQEYGEIEVTRTNLVLDGPRLVELIAQGIKLDRLQSSREVEE